MLRPYITTYSTLISTSTPAGRSSFVSASTVCERESRMSISRLCVFSSNCSRLFLSMCGLRSTVHSCRLVGNGMGPETGAQVSGPIPLPTKRQLWTVLRSPHIDKKSREQFELKTHKRLIDILDSRSQTVDALTKLDLPAGVDVEIKVE